MSLSELQVDLCLLAQAGDVRELENLDIPTEALSDPPLVLAMFTNFPECVGRDMATDAVVLLCMRNPAALAARNDAGCTAFDIMCQHAQLEALRQCCQQAELLEVLLRSQEALAPPALPLAHHANSGEVLSFLAAVGVDLRARAPGTGATAMHAAVAAGSARKVQALAVVAPDLVDAPDAEGRPPIYEALGAACSDDCAKMLMAHNPVVPTGLAEAAEEAGATARLRLIARTHRLLDHAHRLRALRALISSRNSFFMTWETRTRLSRADMEALLAEHADAAVLAHQLDVNPEQQEFSVVTMHTNVNGTLHVTELAADEYLFHIVFRTKNDFVPTHPDELCISVEHPQMREQVPTLSVTVKWLLMVNAHLTDGIRLYDVRGDEMRDTPLLGELKAMTIDGYSSLSHAELLSSACDAGEWEVLLATDLMLDPIELNLTGALQTQVRGVKTTLVVSAVVRRRPLASRPIGELYAAAAASLASARAITSAEEFAAAEQLVPEC